MSLTSFYFNLHCFRLLLHDKVPRQNAMHDSDRYTESDFVFTPVHTEYPSSSCTYSVQRVGWYIYE